MLITGYEHLGYELAPKWLRKSFLFKIFNTSVHHNLRYQKCKRNYGLYFRFWDRIMKTEHPDYTTAYDEDAKEKIWIISQAYMLSKIYPFTYCFTSLTRFRINSTGTSSSISIKRILNFFRPS